MDFMFIDRSYIEILYIHDRFGISVSIRIGGPKGTLLIHIPWSPLSSYITHCNTHCAAHVVLLQLWQRGLDKAVNTIASFQGLDQLLSLAVGKSLATRL